MMLEEIITWTTVGLVEIPIVTALVRLSFLPVHDSHRRDLFHGQQVYRYLARSTFTQHKDGTVTIPARPTRLFHRVLGQPMHGPRLCFYIGHSRRGAWLNRVPKCVTRNGAPADVIIIDGQDFEHAYRGKFLRRRLHDRAVVVADDYRGRARVVRNVDHNQARSTPTPPA